MADHKRIDEDWKAQAEAEKKKIDASMSRSIVGGEGEHARNSRVSLTVLIEQLAAQAMSGLGQVADPRTGRPHVDLELARDSIDMIGLLEEKTRGNLEAAEERTIAILQIEVELPYDLGLGSIEHRRLPGPLSITARADSVDLSFFDAINPAVRDVLGTFNADVGITGSWERPTLTGAMTVANGAASFPSLGVRHEELNGRLELAGDTIHVRALSMRSGVGAASVGGFVRLEELSKPVLGLTIATEDFDALNVPGFVSLTTTGTIDLDGPVFNATMTGSL